MRSPTKSGYGRRTAGLRQVDLDPGHYRLGRWVLLVQGLALSTLGTIGLIANLSRPLVAGDSGVAVLVFRLTPLFSGVLLVFGLAAVVAPVHRRATNWVTGLSVIAAVLAFTIGLVAASRGAVTPWGFTFANVWLAAALMIVDLVLLVWLLPDELQDPGWIRKRQ